MDTAGAPLGLYLHFPWCVRKCPYCDFNSHPLRTPARDTVIPQEDAYVRALLRDLDDALGDVAPATIATLFCGGGTPSLFSPQAFAAILDHARPWLAPAVEVTLEANPGTVEHHDFTGYRRAGINRLSLGAQSFSGEQLSRLGRIHGPDDTIRAFRLARQAGFDNINLDIMYGLPGQTGDGAMADIEAALALEPEHLSWYQLTIEPKTEFARRPPLLASHDEIADMEQRGLERLASAGYRRYEISAFARGGWECRHNTNYWRFGDYIGAGAGAHGKRSRDTGGALRIERISKHAQPRRYLADPLYGERKAVEDPAERTFEFLLNALRLVDGVEPHQFEARTGLAWSELAPTWRALAAEGLVHPHRIAATARGLRYLDTVLQRFLA